MKKQLLGSLVLAGLAVTGCGDDDESSAGNLEEYCRIAAESRTRTDLPSDEELEEALDAAPGEIRDDLEVIFDAFRNLDENAEDPFAVFDTPEVSEAIANVEEFDAEHCDAAATEE